MARPYRVGFWMGIYDNCIFCVGTMCTSSLYLMEYCDFGMRFLLQWNLKMNICGGCTMARPNGNGILLQWNFDNEYL